MLKMFSVKKLAKLMVNSVNLKMKSRKEMHNCVEKDCLNQPMDEHTEHVPDAYFAYTRKRPPTATHFLHTSAEVPMLYTPSTHPAATEITPPSRLPLPNSPRS
ncbi:hypothetical protein BC938DRAFT_473802 [Jimgerdemannia flammicorona]|uniref:Uncharacterized protein n=1 Tax=Jimgerdemannia flammicorona TaxID=994334 RepID=A0A433Q3G1_9FUNG|nr:hypothetical protein BC938DRAFT_473802 [Jimgerdemannia flammicorona]